MPNMLISVKQVMSLMLLVMLIALMPLFSWFLLNLPPHINVCASVWAACGAKVPRACGRGQCHLASKVCSKHTRWRHLALAHYCKFGKRSQVRWACPWNPDKREYSFIANSWSIWCRWKGSDTNDDHQTLFWFMRGAAWALKTPCQKASIDGASDSLNEEPLIP